MRSRGVVIHRWAGLLTALFLFVAGVTGAIISWDHELDEWLNPRLFETHSHGVPLTPVDLVTLLEGSDPRIRVTSVPLHTSPGHTLLFGVEPRINTATGQLDELGYNQVFIDPITGAVIDRRDWGMLAVDRKHLLSFLYKLHYSMHIPRWGTWFMGGIALIWLVDCFIALTISFPDRGRWRKSFCIRIGSRYQFNFDLHRAGGVWTWSLLVILAMSAVYLNLDREIVRPTVSAVATLTPTPFDLRPERPSQQPIEPRPGYGQIIDLARAEALRKGWPEPVGAASYNVRYGIYAVRFFYPGKEHGTGGFGAKQLYFDGLDAAYLGERVPGIGTPGDIFLDVQFPLHSGRVGGIPGRIFISIMGLVVAALSVTGVIIWLKRRGGLIVSLKAPVGSIKADR